MLSSFQKKNSKEFSKYSFATYSATGYTHLPSVQKIQFDIYKTDNEKKGQKINELIVKKLFSNNIIYQMVIGGIPISIRNYIRPRIYNLRRKNFTSIALIKNKLYAVNIPDHCLFEMDKESGMITRRVALDSQPSAISAYQNMIYIYFRKNNSLVRVDTGNRGKLHNFGKLPADKGRIGDIAIDNDGRIWFFTWSNQKRMYSLYSFSLRTKKTRKEGDLPKKRTYTGLSFENHGKSLLISTRDGFFFRWKLEKHRITSRFYNGNIRPAGICTDGSTLYAYNSLNHLIGKFESVQKSFTDMLESTVRQQPDYTASQSVQSMPLSKTHAIQ